MNLYSCNAKCAKFFNSLPDLIREAIMDEMASIDSLVRRVWKSPKMTSGFRRPAYSRSLSGNADSRHAWGAIDYGLDGFPGIEKFKGSGLFVLVEKDHVHVHRS